MRNEKINDTTVCKETDRAHLAITLKCNNNCLFCLQGHHAEAKHRDFKDIKYEIDRSAENGVSKLILSGGEPTTHPDFLKIVRYSKNKGFKQIQAISNGRMFSIPEFTSVAIKSGLTEVTLSIHGHTKEVHDKLVNSPGAFEQVIRSARNLKKYNIIISVDIGIFKPNYRCLPEIIDFVHDTLGLKGDIDLIGPTLAGNALINYDSIMPQYEDAEPYIRDALRTCKEKNIVCWVLRVPLKYMTGYEFYKQDNNKLVEQALSMASALRTFPPKCLGKKCNYCRMGYVCDKIGKLFPFKDDAIDLHIFPEDDINRLNELRFKPRKIILHGPSAPLKYTQSNMYIRNPRYGVPKQDDNNYEFDFVDFDAKMSSLFNINLKLQLSNIKSALNPVVNIIITKKNLSSLMPITERLIDLGCDKVRFTTFNPYNHLKRELSWKTGVHIIDENDVVPDIYKIESSLKNAMNLCKRNNISCSIKEIPPCVFSKKFIDFSEFEKDDFFSSVNISAIDGDEIDFNEYVGFIYNSIFKERIKRCEDCMHKNKCAGFNDMHLKLYSYLSS